MTEEITEAEAIGYGFDQSDFQTETSDYQKMIEYFGCDFEDVETGDLTFSRSEMLNMEKNWSAHKSGKI